MEELKKCPFCCSKAEVMSFLHQYVIGCTKCMGTMLTHNTKEEAITAWNTRKPMERIVERLDEKIEITWKHDYDGGRKDAFVEAIEIVKEEL